MDGRIKQRNNERLFSRSTTHAILIMKLLNMAKQYKEDCILWSAFPPHPPLILHTLGIKTYFRSKQMLTDEK